MLINRQRAIARWILVPTLDMPDCIWPFRNWLDREDPTGERSRFDPWDPTYVEVPDHPTYVEVPDR